MHEAKPFSGLSGSEPLSRQRNRSASSRFQSLLPEEDEEDGGVTLELPAIPRIGVEQFETPMKGGQPSARIAVPGSDVTEDEENGGVSIYEQLGWD